jgi:hypothetical protein
MNKLILIVPFLIFLIFACSPAAEDRQQMHTRAKVFQDSIARTIQQTMAEAGEFIKPFSDSAKVDALKPSGFEPPQ